MARAANAGSRGHRVLLFCGAPRDEVGGTQAVFGGLANYLRAHGDQVTDAWLGAERSFYEDGTATMPLAVRPREDEPRAIFAVRVARDLARLTRTLAKLRPEIVNVHFPRGEALYFILLKPILGYKLVLSFHGADLPPDNRALRMALPFYMRAADAVTTVSDDLREEALQFGPDSSVEVIPNGVDLEYWRPDTDQSTETSREAGLIVAAGRLSEVKGFDLLIDAFANADIPDTRLVIAGDGPEHERLAALAESLGIGDRVEFKGSIDRRSLRSLLRNASLYVLPSRSEGLPLALLEAMACGTPVVATDVGAVSDVVRPECGRVVEPDNADAIAASLRAMLSDPDRREAAGAACRDRARGFDARASYAAYAASLGLMA